MTHDTLYHDDEGLAPAAAAPSAEFINAISEFFDTDPSDLLVELGYYKREAGDPSDLQVTEN